MALPTKVDFIKDRFDPFSEVFSPASIDDEQHTIPGASPFYVRTKEVVKEDSPSSIEIWTGAGKTGAQYTEVSGAPGANQFQVDYKFQSGYIRFNEANKDIVIYVSYNGLGDVIQALHINTVQNVLNLDNIPLPAAGLATDCVETAKIKDGNVTAGKLATDSVETAKIKDGNVTVSKMAANIGDSNYLKIGNWLICWGKGSALTTSTATGNVYASSYRSFTFPVAFIATPIVVAGCEMISGATWPGQMTSVATTGVSVRIMGATNTADGYPTYIAIGKWQ